MIAFISQFIYIYIYICVCVCVCIRAGGPCNVVDSIAAAYGLDGPGTESRWRRDFSHLSRPALRPTQPPIKWVPGLSRSKVRRARDPDPSTPSSAEVKNRVEL
jgi:hypothetical protein